MKDNLIKNLDKKKMSQMCTKLGFVSTPKTSLNKMKEFLSSFSYKALVSAM
jgi:hypothetical protein